MVKKSSQEQQIQQALAAARAKALADIPERFRPKKKEVRGDAALDTPPPLTLPQSDPISPVTPSEVLIEIPSAAKDEKKKNRPLILDVNDRDIVTPFQNHTEFPNDGLKKRRVAVSKKIHEESVKAQEGLPEDPIVYFDTRPVDKDLDKLPSYEEALRIRNAELGDEQSAVLPPKAKEKIEASPESQRESHGASKPEPAVVPEFAVSALSETEKPVVLERTERVMLSTEVPQTPVEEVGGKSEKEQLLSPEEWSEKIGSLRNEVGLIRTNYAEALAIEKDEKSLYEKIRKMLPGVKQEPSKDLASAREKYQGKLIELQTAEFERLKQSGLKGKALKEALAETLRYFQIDEHLNLYEAETTEWLNQREKHWLGKGVSYAEKCVAWYHKQTTKKKIAIAVGLGLGTVAAAGVGAVMAAGVFAGVRRGLGMAAGTATANAILEKRQVKKREEKLLKDFEAKSGYAGDESEASLLKEFEKRFQAIVGGLDTRMAEWQGEDNDRKRLAAVIGIGGGFAFSEGVGALMQHGGNEWVEEGYRKLGISLKGFSGTSLPATETVENGFDGKALTPTPIPAFEAPAVVEPGAEMVSEKSEILNNYLQERVAEKGDSLWKYSTALGEQMGLENVDQMRFATLIEKAIREKIEADPSLVKAAGFMDGEKLWLQAGKPVHLQAVLTPEELQGVLKEMGGENIKMADIASPSSALEAALASDESFKEVQSEVVKMNEGLGKEAENTLRSIELTSKTMGAETIQPEVAALSAGALGVASIAAKNRIRPVFKAPETTPQKAILKSFAFGIDMNAYIGKLSKQDPQILKIFMRKLTDQSTTLLSLPGVRGFNGKIFGLKVQEIVEAEKSLQEKKIVFLPLEASQMERISGFVRNCRRQFGMIGTPGKGEDFKTYLARMNAAADAVGVELRFLEKNNL